MSISNWCLLLGAILAFNGAGMVVLPETSRKILKGFPRNRYAGWLLCAAGWIWAAYATLHMGLDVFEPYKPYVPYLAAVMIPLSCWALDNLLACRGYAAICCLLPSPLFYAARTHESLWRLVPVVFGYLLAVKGMFAMFYPWIVRREIDFVCASRLRLLAYGLAHLVVGALFLALAFTALR